MNGKKNHICMPYFGSADVVVNEAVKDPMVPHSAARDDASHTSAAMDHRHVRCCSQMHGVIRLHPSSFDELPTLRYLGMCTKGAPDQQATTNMAAALATIPETPDASIETDTTCMFDAKHTGRGTAYALDMTGYTCPGMLAAAILDNAGAGSAPSFDLYAPSAIKSTVKHVDPSELFRPLFSQLDAGRVDFCPATRMIKATVAYNCHMACDANPAPRTSNRLDQRRSSPRACRVHRSGHPVQRDGNLQPACTGATVPACLGSVQGISRVYHARRGTHVGATATAQRIALANSSGPPPLDIAREAGGREQDEAVRRLRLSPPIRHPVALCRGQESYRNEAPTSHDPCPAFPWAIRGGRRARTGACPCHPRTAVQGPARRGHPTCAPPPVPPRHSSL